jgi:pentatricopeptide repeat protein
MYGGTCTFLAFTHHHQSPSKSAQKTMMRASKTKLETKREPLENRIINHHHLETHRDSLQGGNRAFPQVSSLLFDSCCQKPRSPADFAIIFLKMSEHASDTPIEASEPLKEEPQHEDDTKMHTDPENGSKPLSSIEEEKSDPRSAEQQGIGPVEEKEKAKPSSPEEGPKKEEVESVIKIDMNGNDEYKLEEETEPPGKASTDKPTQEGSNYPSSNDDPPSKKQKLEESASDREKEEPSLFKGTDDTLLDTATNGNHDKDVEMSFVEEKESPKSPKDMKESEQIKESSSTSVSTPFNEQLNGDGKAIAILEPTKDIEDEAMQATESRIGDVPKSESASDIKESQVKRDEDAKVAEGVKINEQLNGDGKAIAILEPTKDIEDEAMQVTEGRIGDVPKSEPASDIKECQVKRDEDAKVAEGVKIEDEVAKITSKQASVNDTARDSKDREIKSGDVAEEEDTAKEEAVRNGKDCEIKSEDAVMKEKESAKADETNEKDDPTAEQASNGHDAEAMQSEESENKSNGEGDKEKADGDKSKPKPKHIRKKDVDPKVLEVRRRVQVGCRLNDLATAMEVYEEALANDVRVEAQSFYNLLNLCDGLERAVHIGTPKTTCSTEQTEPAKVIRPVDADTRQKHAFRIKQRMDELKLPLNETAFTALVKVLCRNKQVDEAEKLLDDAERIQQCRPKLRLYSAILITHCEMGNLKRALQVWKRLTDQNLVILEKECTAMMQCGVSIGSSMVMQSVLSDLAEDVLVPSKDSVAAVLQWFESPHAIHKDEVAAQLNAEDTNLIRTLLKEIHQNIDELPPSMGPVVCTKGWIVSSMCPIDIKTGILQKGCLKGCKLKPVALSDRSWAEMKRMNESIVVDGQIEGHSSKFQGGRKGKKRRGFSPEERQARWTLFCDFLEKKDDLDVVIDGANIGYYQTNFTGASKHVDYVQINWIVQHFLKRNKKVLLVLHERHFATQMMPAQYRPIVDEWERLGVLYKSPPGMNDDWFWLHAALTYKTLVITNDEMRDHHFQMLAPRMFLRWKDRHMIHFSFGGWTPNTDGKGGPNVRQVELVYPEIYSRRIQRVRDGLVVPLAKRGDENRFLDGTHIACDDEPIEETYLSISPRPVSTA